MNRGRGVLGSRMALYRAIRVLVAVATVLAAAAVFPCAALAMRVSSLWLAGLLAAVLVSFLLLCVANALLARYAKTAPEKRIGDMLRELGYLDDEFADRDIQEQDRLLIEIIREYADRASMQELMRDRAEYSALQSQINPHFLYNTLDTIRGKAMESELEEVSEMIESLSRIFRYSITNHSDMLTLEDELKNVRDYINIQKTRFANRFTVNYLLDEADWQLMTFRVPKLILQPLVENAIVHGLDQTVSGGVVNLHAYRTSNLVVVKVEDNGGGIAAAMIKEMNVALRGNGAPAQGVRGGLALYNINKRIRMLYGEDYGLIISSLEGRGATVEIVMPFRESDYAAGNLAHDPRFKDG